MTSIKSDLLASKENLRGCVIFIYFFLSLRHPTVLLSRGFGIRRPYGNTDPFPNFSWEDIIYLFPRLLNTSVALGSLLNAPISKARACWANSSVFLSIREFSTKCFPILASASAPWVLIMPVVLLED